MHAVILGGTGFLGESIAQQLLEEGQEVTATSRTPRPTAGRTRIDSTRYRSVRLDVEAATPAQLDSLFGGADAVVMAFGADDRQRSPRPARNHFQRRLVAPTARVADAAARVGVPRLVVTGSYYSWFSRVHPQWRLAEHHPYIAARNAQAEQAIAAGGGTTSVSVLEIPWVFGAVPGLVPQWKAMIFEPLRRSPVAFELPGGTAVVSNTAVAVACARLVTGAAPAGRHPVATGDLDQADLTRWVLDELGMPSKRRLTLGRRGVHLGLQAERARMALLRLDSGLDPRTFADVMARQLSIDPGRTESVFGIAPEDPEELVRATVRHCYPTMSGM